MKKFRVYKSGRNVGTREVACVDKIESAVYLIKQLAGFFQKAHSKKKGANLPKWKHATSYFDDGGIINLLERQTTDWYFWGINKKDEFYYVEAIEIGG